MKALYLEPDEEITSVIDRLAAIDDPEVAVVIPRRAGVLQSIINLKLLRQQAEQQKKRVSIVTTDKTGRNLASAVGLTVYQKLPEGGEAADPAVKETAGTPIPITFRKRTPTEAAAKPAVTGPTIADIGYKQPPTPAIAVTPVAAAVERATGKSVSSSVKKVSKPDQAGSPTPKASAGDVKPASRRWQRLHPLKKIRARQRSMAAAAGSKGRKGWWRSRRFGFAALILVVIGGGATAVLLLPRATIVLSPATEAVKYDTPVSFSLKAPAVDPATNVIPAKIIEVTRETAVQVPATGFAPGGAKAGGQLTVTNNLSRDQSLVARTRFQAPNGVIFRAQTAIKIPAGGQTSVAVVADTGGEAGNLPAGTTLTLPALPGGAVTAVVNTALSGGSNSATTEISADDVEKAKALLASQAAVTGVDEAKTKLAVGYTIKDTVSSTLVLTATPNQKVGVEATTFTVAGRVKVTYFTYQQSDLDKALADDAKTHLPKGAEVAVNGLEQQFAPTQPSADNLTGVMHSAQLVTHDFDQAAVKRQLAGLTGAEASAKLAAGGLTGTSVKLSPFWVHRVPKQDWQIHFTIRAVNPTATPSASPITPSPGQ